MHGTHANVPQIRWALQGTAADSLRRSRERINAAWQRYEVPLKANVQYEAFYLGTQHGFSNDRTPHDKAAAALARNGR